MYVLYFSVRLTWTSALVKSFLFICSMFLHQHLVLVSRGWNRNCVVLCGQKLSLDLWRLTGMDGRKATLFPPCARHMWVGGWLGSILLICSHLIQTQSKEGQTLSRIKISFRRTLIPIHVLLLARFFVFHSM